VTNPPEIQREAYHKWRAKLLLDPKKLAEWRKRRSKLRKNQPSANLSPDARQAKNDRQRERMTDAYVAIYFRTSVKNVPPELLALKRAQLQLIRTIENITRNEEE